MITDLISNDLSCRAASGETNPAQIVLKKVQESLLRPSHLSVSADLAMQLNQGKFEYNGACG